MSVICRLANWFPNLC